MKVLLTREGKEDVVKITKEDIWDLDQTLAKIIYPALLKLKEAKAGSPFVDNKDVPKRLRSIKGSKPKDGGVDENWHERWQYVLNEMIWAFEQFHNKEYGLFLSYNKMRNRFHKGLSLFGKYYQSLWV